VLQRWLEAHGRRLVGVLVAVWGGGLAAFLALVVVYDLDFLGPIGGPWVLAFGSFAVTGAIITWHRPGHMIGLLFLALGLSAPTANTILALAMGPFADQAVGVRSVVVAAGVALTTPVMPLLMLTIALFPDGRLPSPRWRWLPWTTAVAGLVGGTAAFTAGGWGGDRDQILLTPPFDGRFLVVADVLSPLFFLLMGVLIAGSTWAAVLRYRRSESLERQQLKWLALVALLLTLVFAVVVLTQGAAATPPGVVTMVVAAGISLVPVAATIAVLRHGLYDIDVVLNRTLVFGSLAVFITALYATVVVGVGSMIGDRSNLVLTVGTTALVAVAFEPVRARVQHWANRVVYGPRATPYEVLTAIIGELGSTSASDQLDGMASLLSDGTGAAHASVWVHVDGGLTATACSPGHDTAEHHVLPVDQAGDVQVPGASHTEPVWGDGELLGALSFERGRDDPVTPHERALLAEMAGQASLVLGNARLRERLRVRVEELRSSRQRLVAAQNDARRRLERNLHDGAQQQLVALKVKLGLARTIAAKEEAGEQVIELLEGLSASADEAVDSLRTLARGIYPPLLEAEGLGRALVAQARRCPVPVSVEATSVRRYAPQVEATVYFCVLEALRNAVTHADAGEVAVTVEDRDGRLTFCVADDGSGFDPDAREPGLGLTNMGDRLDALGGSMTVDSRLGAGTRVTGAIPVLTSGGVDTAPEPVMA
jgi:signal transduction histidine kinase